MTTGHVQGWLEFHAPRALAPAPPAPAREDTVVWVRSPRARRYRLTLRRDGVAVLTLPARGDRREAERFLAQQTSWLARARARLAAKPRAPDAWPLGARVLWRGEELEIRASGTGARPAVRLGGDSFRLASLEGDLRPVLEKQFQRLARIELPARAWELAAQTRMPVTQVRVRNQRTRWGSCSAAGVISLNWRLIRLPETVRDYIIYHELMHLKEMNHSARFWRRVGEVCPSWREAEAWLKTGGALAGM